MGIFLGSPQEINSWRDFRRPYYGTGGEGAWAPSMNFHEENPTAAIGSLWLKAFCWTTINLDQKPTQEIFFFASLDVKPVPATLETCRPFLTATKIRSTRVRKVKKDHFTSPRKRRESLPCFQETAECMMPAIDKRVT